MLQPMGSQRAGHACAAELNSAVKVHPKGTMSVRPDSPSPYVEKH